MVKWRYELGHLFLSLALLNDMRPTREELRRGKVPNPPPTLSQAFLNIGLRLAGILQKHFVLASQVAGLSENRGEKEEIGSKHGQMSVDNNLTKVFRLS